MNDLKRELEARNLSAKGLKSQLVARLTNALKSECDKESGEKQVDQDVDMKTDDAEESIEDEKKKDKVFIIDFRCHLIIFLFFRIVL